MWAAQNAMMAAYHAGSPCPELAAAAAVGNAWGLGAGKLGGGLGQRLRSQALAYMCAGCCTASRSSSRRT